ncbi:hypothetical protein MMYC01_201744 [Madurella mycetomatis]|uniref:Uncharacterized protein n=1 Tax=Madurella mycetomatis TaxID=100816 RepID=A0A175WF12_9PEZI|nr:hypothetical protein MMYC01_201744 [Madurella mycetomatis]
MDPSFHEARQRFTKPKPVNSPFKSTKFQRQLARNPYARALATPPRRCPISCSTLPNFFLERFALIAHPDTRQPWFVPQDLESKASGTAGATAEPRQGIRTGPSAYVLSRQLLFQELKRGDSPYHSAHKRLFRMSDHGQSRLPLVLKQASWRSDMDTFILELIRRRVVESLLHFATISEKEGRKKYLVKCETWDGVKELKHRGCLLFLGRQEGGCSDSEPESPPPRLSTMTIDGVKFGRKLAVHNLMVLLGEEHTARLRRESWLLRDGSLFLLGRQATVKLQMLLWKLQGYMAWGKTPGTESLNVSQPENEPATRKPPMDPPK